MPTTTFMPCGSTQGLTTLLDIRSASIQPVCQGQDHRRLAVIDEPAIHREAPPRIARRWRGRAGYVAEHVGTIAIEEQQPDMVGHLDRGGKRCGAGSFLDDRGEVL